MVWSTDWLVDELAAHPTYFLLPQLSRYRNNEIVLAVAIVVFGFFGFGGYPVCMEMAVEITYPVAEATSSGLLFISG